MFKCVECGAEYKTKPDYCECGNDIFELVDDVEEIEIATPQQEPHQFQNQYSYSANSAFSVQPSAKSPFDPISLIIFLFCVLMAVITLFFIGNPKNTTQAPKQVHSQPVNTNIPSVDSYWDNSVAKLAATTNNTVEVDVDLNSTVQKEAPKNTQPEAVDPITAKFEKWLNSPSKYQQTANNPPTPKPVTQTKQTKQSVYTPVTSSVQQAKIQTKVNNSQADLISRVQKQYSAATKTAATQPKAKTQTQTVQNTTTSAKTAQTQKTTGSRPIDPFSNIDLFSTEPAKKTTTAASQPAATKTISTTATAHKTTTTAKTTTTVKPAKSQAALQQELLTYKASLRNTIGRKINFANVVGDGSCSITFALNSSGKLTNRKFAQQSPNITLNDAVYSAMMATPSYNPPPEGYKNETLTFYVKIYNGNFEITLR